MNISSKSRPSSEDRCTIRTPRPEDAPAVHGLINRCPPLDLNSMYCYLLQCTDYEDTCAVAESNDQILAWASAYRQPVAPSILFVWQVAVDCEARGQGLARRLIISLLNRDAVSGIEGIKATVTPENNASRVFFKSLAETLGAPISVTPHFDRHAHFAGQHSSEHLISIGPIAPRRARIEMCAQ